MVQHSLFFHQHHRLFKKENSVARKEKYSNLPLPPPPRPPPPRPPPPRPPKSNDHTTQWNLFSDTYVHHHHVRHRLVVHLTSEILIEIFHDSRNLPRLPPKLQIDNTKKRLNKYPTSSTTKSTTITSACKILIHRSWYLCSHLPLPRPPPPPRPPRKSISIKI